VKIRFHDLRHTFGTRLGEAGRSPYEIARLMGHANIQTSMIYVHPEPESLRKAVEAASAR
jgi:integrase/recombinase XerC